MLSVQCCYLFSGPLSLAGIFVMQVTGLYIYFVELNTHTQLHKIWMHFKRTILTKIVKDACTTIKTMYTSYNVTLGQLRPIPSPLVLYMYCMGEYNVLYMACDAVNNALS